MNPRFFLAGLLLLIGAFPGAFVRAAEVKMDGISLPFFDPTGKPTHKLVAKTGTKSGSLKHLQEVEIQYFSAQDPSVIVQKVQADEATWDDQKETLVGNGRILVATQENRLTGEGFDFALATSLLHVQRNFKMENREIVLTSDRATIELLIERAGEELKVRDVKRCEAIGNLQIVVQPTATQDYRFEKAFSEIAVYEGPTQTVTLPKPSTLLRKDGRGTVQTMTFHLKDEAK